MALQFICDEVEVGVGLPMKKDTTWSLHDPTSHTDAGNIPLVCLNVDRITFPQENLDATCHHL